MVRSPWHQRDDQPPCLSCVHAVSSGVHVPDRRRGCRAQAGDPDCAAGVGVTRPVGGRPNAGVHWMVDYRIG